MERSGLGWKELLAAPAVIVPKKNSLCAEPETTTENEAPTYPALEEEEKKYGGPVEHGVPAETTSAAFVLASPVPVSCAEHGVVNLQATSWTTGPFSVNVPISNLKSEALAGAGDQQSR